MARDYVQRNVKRKPRSKRPQKKQASGLPGWVWLFAGLCIGLAIAVFAYISRPVEPMPGAGAIAEPAPAAQQTQQKPAVEIPPEREARFSFYELLPSQEVVIPDEPTPPPSSKAEQAKESVPPAEKPASGAPAYMIMVASFRDQSNAQEQKAQLAFLGIQSRVEKVTIDGTDTFYRVRVGPEKSLAKAQSTLAQLRDHGVEGVLIKLK